MAVLPSPQSTHKFYQADGVTPAAAYEVYTYSAGTTTPLATYSDAAGLSANTNPIILNANGEASIYVTAGVSYDIVLKYPGGGAQIGATQRVITDGTSAIRTDLASSTGGATLVSMNYGIGPAYLQTLSAIRQGEPIPAICAIPAAQHAGIYAGTSTYDAAADLNDILSDMVSRGGELVLPHGRIYLLSGLTIDHSAIASEDTNTRFTIRGQGAKTTEIRLFTATSGNVLGINGKWGIPMNITVEGMRLTGFLNSTRAIRAFEVSGLLMRDVVCRNADIGWELIDCLNVQGYNANTIFNNHGAQLSRSTRTYPNGIHLFGGSIGGNYTSGLLSTGGSCLALSGVHCEGNGSSLALASTSGWGVKVVDPGYEGGLAVSIDDGCYFENNNGRADVWIVQGVQSCSAMIAGSTFNRISSGSYVTNNIALDTSGSGTIHAAVNGCGFFTAGTYSRNSARRTIAAAGVSGSIHYAYTGCSGVDANLADAPTMAQAGRLLDPDCMPQAWARVAGATGSVQSSRRIASVVRNGTGDYTVTLDHDMPAAKSYDINLESSSVLCWQLFSETGTAVRFTVKNSGGVATDPDRFYFRVYG
jgi:hypothetical protein